MKKVGFLGVGWIGQQRMRAVIDSGLVEVAAIADPSRELREAALALAPGARSCEGLDALLAWDLDGIAIATPSALHAQQALAALDRGLSVFCQKPLARTRAETRELVDRARARDRLLQVDFSYRHTEALRALKSALPELGPVYTGRLVFHNAYGPDKPWYYDPASAGGGCVMDLGVHLIDALMWLLDGARVERVESALFARGTPLAAGQVEDYASVRLHLAGGAVVELACSWKLPVGRDAQIELELFARDGALRMRNVAGSFYDFVAERTRGTSCERLVDPPDAWGGRAIVAWAKQLAQSAQFDPSAQRFVDVAGVIDQIYGRVAELPRARQNATCEFDALRDSVTDARAHSAIGST